MVIITSGSSSDTTSIGDGNISIDLAVPQTVTQGTWVNTVSTSALSNKYINNNTADADGDGLEWNIFITPGTYRLDVLYLTQGAGGIADFYVNDVEIASVDTYAASGTYNTVDSTTGISITAEGVTTFKILIDGQHASSTGYRCFLQTVTLTRTA